MYIPIKKILFFVLLLFLAFLIVLTVNHQDSRETMIRSTSLEKKITYGADYERINYIDEKGSITYAADKHYATLIIQKNDNSVLEEYYGTDGEPARQVLGNYFVHRLYDDNKREYKTIYMDLDKNPVITRIGYAIVIRTFNDKGKVDKELYFDNKNQPVETKAQGYGCKYVYDEKGQSIKTIYLGADGQPIISGQGFAIVHKTYYEDGDNKGRIKDEYYFDEKEQPIKLKNGQYGIHKDYDMLGRMNTYTYLDADGNPINTLEGYSTIIRSFYNDDSDKSDMYYDKDGNPVALSKGQYGILRKEGRNILLDKNGHEMESLYNLLYGLKWFSIIMCFIAVIISSFLNRKYNVILLILFFLIIIFLTTFNRSSASGGINLVPFWSYRRIIENNEIAIQILNNILLFIPFGTILYRVWPTKKSILVVVLFSALIELVQCFMNIGLCEIDDIISNSIGGCIGYSVGKSIDNIKNKNKEYKAVEEIT